MYEIDVSTYPSGQFLNENRPGQQVTLLSHSRKEENLPKINCCIIQGPPTYLGLSFLAVGNILRLVSP